MIYEYKCSPCSHTWEENILMVDREKPLSLPCPSCKESGKISRVLHATALASHGVVTPQQKAGDGWNDTLKRIHMGAGKDSKIQLR